MAKKSENLLLPLIKAALVHVLMFMLLFTSFHSTSKEQPLEIQVNTAPIIKATAISSKTIEKLIQQKELKKKQQSEAAAKAERDRKRRIRQKAERAAKKKQAALDKKKRVAAEEKLKVDQENKRIADAVIKRKADAEIKRKADAETKRKADLERRRKEKLEQELEAQMQAEENTAREQIILTELQKYVALIKNKISRNWIISNQSGKCILEVKLASGGLVIGVREVGGEAAICRSAKAAVYKADPLPVSNDPAIFNRMRTLRLDLDPQEL